MQVFIRKRNPITGDSEWDMQHEDFDYYQDITRSAFADMLHDTERNKKYHKALQLAIEKMHEAGKKANVLDIGTGTGLLSIMAARCGADTIIACEGFEPMAECCLSILKSNGVIDKITVIPKKSTDLTVGEDGDMKEKANILVTEVFDTELIGEGALATFSHALENLLEKDCIVIPDSAVIYAQVVECPTLQKWNTLNDLVDEDLNVILRTPKKVKECPGTSAVHDIQLSQLPRHLFKELSDQIPVFYFDWSGRSSINPDRTVTQQFTVTNTGKSQVVFMWWELNMDMEGKICISCAPWWSHPDVDTSSERPQDTIPWRDHWMQGVYFLPQEITLKKGSEASLVSCHDEYSMWFHLEDQKNKLEHYKRPICDCGTHLTISRTHLSYLNDGKRSKKLLAQLKKDLMKDSIVLDLNGSGLLGLAAAKMGAKQVFIYECLKLNANILEKYIKENNIKNVAIICELTDEFLAKITNVTCDPIYSSATLPWDNLKVAYLLYKYRSKLTTTRTILPDSCEFWVMPIEFKDLQKIRIPVGTCEGVDMALSDSLVESCRILSDAALEPQPLWEYPCICRGMPRQLVDIQMKDLKSEYSGDGEYPINDTESEGSHTVNGFVVWAVWTVGGKQLSAGPVEVPTIGERVVWDMHSRQAVQIFKTAKTVSYNDKWNYQMVCEVEKGHFNLILDWVAEAS